MEKGVKSRFWCPDNCYNSNYLWRIVFTLMIALLHSNYIVKSGDIGWYIAVDYFFIISGYMLVNSFMRKKQSTGKYIMGRIGKLWPYQLFAFAAFLIWYLCSGSIGSILDCVDVTLKHLNEVVPFGYFMFDPEFAGGYAYNFPVWYLTVLLVCSLIIYFLLDKCEAALKYVIAPVAVVLIYGYLYLNCPSFNTGNGIGLFLNDYYVRGFAGMCIGVIIYFIVREIQKYEFRKSMFWLFRIVEFFCMGGVIVMSYAHGGKNDCWWVVLMGVGVLCSFLYSSEHKISARINTAVFVKWLSELMYPVFLNHILVIQVLEWCGVKGITGINLIMYIILLLGYSVITKLCVDKSVKLVKKIAGYMVRRKTESIK